MYLKWDIPLNGPATGPTLMKQRMLREATPNFRQTQWQTCQSQETLPLAQKAWFNGFVLDLTVIRIPDAGTHYPYVSTQHPTQGQSVTPWSACSFDSFLIGMENTMSLDCFKGNIAGNSRLMRKKNIISRGFFPPTH